MDLFSHSSLCSWPVCKYGEYGSFEHLLFLSILVIQTRPAGPSVWWIRVIWAFALLVNMSNHSNMSGMAVSIRRMGHLEAIHQCYWASSWVWADTLNFTRRQLTAKHKLTFSLLSLHCRDNRQPVVYLIAVLWYNFMLQSHTSFSVLKCHALLSKDWGSVNHVNASVVVESWVVHSACFYQEYIFNKGQECFCAAFVWEFRKLDTVSCIVF